MASKGQKFRKYDDVTKQKVIQEYSEGTSELYLSKKYGIPKGTITTWYQKHLHPEKYPGSGQKKGRPKESELSQEDWKERYEILKKYQAFLKEQREKR